MGTTVMSCRPTYLAIFVVAALCLGCDDSPGPDACAANGGCREVDTPCDYNLDDPGCCPGLSCDLYTATCVPEEDATTETTGCE